MKKYTRNELAILNKELSELNVEKTYNKNLLFAISKNLKKLKENFDIVVEKEKTIYSEAYKTFEESRMSLLKVYGDRDDNGELILSNGNVSVSKNIEEFNEKVKELIETNKEVIEETNKAKKEYEELLNEVIEIDLTLVDEQYIPEELTPKQFVIFEMITKEE